MKRMRQAARVDANQPDIVKALRKAGAWVQSIGQPFDLLVHYRGRWHVLEVKDGEKTPCQQELSPTQLDTLASLRLNGVVLVRTVDEALAAVGAKVWPQ